jgi:putative transposase
LVIADAHLGLRSAVDAVLTRTAVQTLPRALRRQRARPSAKGDSEMVAAAIRTSLGQPDAEHVHDQLNIVASVLGRQTPARRGLAARQHRGPAGLRQLPLSHRRKIWSTHPLERLDREIKRRTDVVGVSPNPPALLRLAGAVLVEAHDDWQVSDRRYLSRDPWPCSTPRPPPTSRR